MIEAPAQKGAAAWLSRSDGGLPTLRLHSPLAGKTEIKVLSGVLCSPAFAASGSGACSSRARPPEFA